MKQVSDLVTIRAEQLVPGGQALATLPDGRKVFVWNALPGEEVRARLIKQKRSYAEAIAEEVVRPSADRIEPREPNFLATSPWQILDYAAENRYKNDIVTTLAKQHHATATVAKTTLHDARQWHYRNKMEYSFWGDDAGLHLALFTRGSHQKHIVQGSALAMPVIDAAARAVLEQLQQLQIRAGELKTIIVRSDQAGRAVAALYVKPMDFPALALPDELAGLRVYHSSPKSPASVPTRLLAEYGDTLLHDRICGVDLKYDVSSFFQVNLPVFERALGRIQQSMVCDRLVDMYAGVGSIGLNVAQQQVTLVELDPASAAMARQNISASKLDATVIETSSEQALEYIAGDMPVIFDPPRAGLHHKVVDRILAAKPPTIAYLSCNPATQMRDLALLQDTYTIEPIEVFNFFPRTPHIETLAMLRRNKS